jgi:hypothetical protein
MKSVVILASTTQLKLRSHLNKDVWMCSILYQGHIKNHNLTLATRIFHTKTTDTNEVTIHYQVFQQVIIEQVICVKLMIELSNTK